MPPAVGGPEEASETSECDSLSILSLSFRDGRYLVIIVVDACSHHQAIRDRMFNSLILLTHFV